MENLEIQFLLLLWPLTYHSTRREEDEEKKDREKNQSLVCRRQDREVENDLRTRKTMTTTILILQMTKEKNPHDYD